MKRKLLSLMLVGTMAASMVACGSSADTATDSASTDATEDAAATADVQSDDENTLTVYAWDENFNIPALQAAEKDYQDVNPDFHLEIITQSQSSDVENAVTLAAEAGDYSTLPDISSTLQIIQMLGSQLMMQIAIGQDLELKSFHTLQ